MSNHSVAFYTLGCKVNQYDTETVKDLFRSQGYQIVLPDQFADIYIINTCTVTNMADRKSRQRVRKFLKLNPRAVIVVMGCYAQVSPDTVKALEGVDLVIGTRDRGKIVDLVDELMEIGGDSSSYDVVSSIMKQTEFEEFNLKHFPDRTRHFIKVQEGCDYYCSYCIVPYARGHIRSRTVTSVLHEVNSAVDLGFREIVLTGINLGAYGRDQQNYPDLAGLISMLTTDTDINRIRLSSCEPMEITGDLIKVIRDSDKVAHHLHIPLQSGDDSILTYMGRPYTTTDFQQLVKDIRVNIPDIAITTDVIVGFPGETEENFQNTKSLVREVGFSDLHVFKFSPRQFTKAACMSGQIPNTIKSNRSQELIQLGKELTKQYAQRFLWGELVVLVEEQTEEVSTGLTGNYLKVNFNTNKIEVKEGDLCLVKVHDIEDEKINGDMIKKYK